MRWLKHTVSLLLLLAAVGIAIGTAFSDHSDDYGRAPLPQGGIVELPAGKVVVFYEGAGGAGNEVRVPFTFQVTPAGGGPPVPVSTDDGKQIANADQRSATIGELDAVAKLDVPSAGSYLVSASGNLDPGTAALEFGTNAGAAVLAKWRLLAGLVLAALLVALIPVPRRKRHRGDETDPAGGWSSDPRTPYAG